MAAAPLTISADRQLYVNFSAPFDLQPYTFMHARPKGSSKALLFVDPFTPLVRLSPNSQCWALLTEFFLLLVLGVAVHLHSLRRNRAHFVGHPQPELLLQSQ